MPYSMAAKRARDPEADDAGMAKLGAAMPLETRHADDLVVAFRNQKMRILPVEAGDEVFLFLLAGRRVMEKHGFEPFLEEGLRIDRQPLCIVQACLSDLKPFRMVLPIQVQLALCYARRIRAALSARQVASSLPDLATINPFDAMAPLMDSAPAMRHRSGILFCVRVAN